MPTTKKEGQLFTEGLIQSDLLENAIKWMKLNLKPEDVFDQKQLEDWAKRNDFQMNPL